MTATSELQKALSNPGTLAAGRFLSDGRTAEFQANVEGLSREVGGMASQFAASISMLLGTFSASYSVLSQIPLVPLHGWTYSGGSMTSVIERDLWSMLDTQQSSFRRPEPAREKTLHELVSLHGVRLAAYYAPDGSTIAHEQTIPLSHEMRATATQIVASVVATMRGLAMAFTRLSGQRWAPFGVLIYSGGDWTIAASGTRWLLADAGECQLLELYQALPW